MVTELQRRAYEAYLLGYAHGARRAASVTESEIDRARIEMLAEKAEAERDESVQAAPDAELAERHAEARG